MSPAAASVNNAAPASYERSSSPPSHPTYTPSTTALPAPPPKKQVTRDTIELQGKLEGDAPESLPYGICVWSTGNAARPLVRDLVATIPGQARYSSPARPAASKLAVDPFLRVVGARDMIAIGDCSMMLGERLPATAQVRVRGTRCMCCVRDGGPGRGGGGGGGARAA